MRVNSLLLGIFIVAVVVVWIAAERAGTQAATPDSNSLAADLQTRAKQYLEFRKKVAGNPPRSTGTPAKITTAQNELANKVRVARAGVRQGAIFTPEIAEFVRRQIAATLASKDGQKIRASLQNAEPVNLSLQVNESYPEDVPLQSTPPSLLLNLPELPKGLEYRLLGRELVLRDVDANIIVDYVPNAVTS